MTGNISEERIAKMREMTKKVIVPVVRSHSQTTPHAQPTAPRAVFTPRKKQKKHTCLLDACRKRKTEGKNGHTFSFYTFMQCICGPRAPQTPFHSVGLGLHFDSRCILVLRCGAGGLTVIIDTRVRVSTLSHGPPSRQQHLYFISTSAHYLTYMNSSPQLLLSHPKK